ncbi:hypothetical protein [Rhizobium ruizarguesonis]|uniref:hypothetical protein n=1 Tax=Rhizobium ruizarguesonis TaxID=2081791 RepID=UPI0010325168|nr:hypothetical protein [Rhizobium ruizarguesonis]TAW60510.1 hypothetical protein ELI10_38015 [Rhizobium ruizarguesonis]TAX01305.1 hypothetical protein ELI09_37925 [Rhizobium ruizarguesonis]TAX02980.1 hypothetical protein ELI08_37965 [Rhizobium ruizarguesonis]
MQFRTVKGRVQCYAAYYDSSAKRTRQKLVYILGKYGQINTKPTPDQLTPDFGTTEQRLRWANEIAAYIDEHNATETTERVERLPLILRSNVDAILADLRSKTPILNVWHRARIKSQVERLARGVGLITRAKPKPAKKTKAATSNPDRASPA